MIINHTKKIHEQITPDNWGQGNNFMDKYGNITCKEEACRACITGWIALRYYHQYNKVRDQLAADVTSDNRLVGWNDHPDRTFEEVHAALVRNDL